MKKRSNIMVLFLFVLIMVGTACGAEQVKQEESVLGKEDELSSFTAATIQFNPTLNEKDDNVQELLESTREAFENGSKLVVAPEMATTGYMYGSREEIEPFVETIPGETTDKFSELAKEYDSYIVFGMPEVDEETNLFYNTAVLIGPDGFEGKYRKTQMWETEMHWGAWGDEGIPVFETSIGNIAINICMDSAYFETARAAGIKGADILTFPTNSSAQAISALPARAQQNGFYVLSANRSNTEKGFHMIGGSAIWSPYGEELAEAPVAMTEEEAIDETVIEYAEIDPKEYSNTNKARLDNRRPELYTELLHYIHPWDETKNIDSKDVNALALQYEPITGNQEKNEEKITALIEEIDKEEVDLVVLPETSLIGSMDGLNDEEIYNLAEEKDGETKEFMSALAEELEAAIIYGFIERDGGDLYNSAMLLDEDGENTGTYRKTHLSEEDDSWATAGDELPVFETDNLGKIGILIGGDAVYPEAAGVLAVNRADIIAIPSAWEGQYGGQMEINRLLSENTYPEHSMVTWDAVAMGAQAYTIVSNFVGADQNFLGGSGLYTIDPLYGLDQPVIASQQEEKAQFVEFQTLQEDWWFNQEKLLASRQPSYYKSLIQE